MSAGLDRALSGSSPHARGARHDAHGILYRHRIIPACAGSTGTWPRASTRATDHPRMRGEHGGRVVVAMALTGSSPHARGAHRGHRPQGRLGGIIPACAGSTTHRGPPTRRTGDHPRMRGEHLIPTVPAISQKGSSPHARGARAHVAAVSAARGIIPACAGSTGMSKATKSTSGGSSPHARGALGDGLVERRLDGIIPACAGSTPSPSPA